MTRKPSKRHYGYGIVGKSGKPWWNEDSCVCEDRQPMLETCADLNDKYNGSFDDPERPYRVVKLFYETRKR